MKATDQSIITPKPEMPVVIEVATADADNMTLAEAQAVAQDLAAWIVQCWPQEGETNDGR